MARSLAHLLVREPTGPLGVAAQARQSRGHAGAAEVGAVAQSQKAIPKGLTAAALGALLQKPPDVPRGSQMVLAVVPLHDAGNDPPPLLVRRHELGRHIALARRGHGFLRLL